MIICIKNFNCIDYYSILYMYFEGNDCFDLLFLVIVFF